ncbi:hypothetical protein OG21DRAFT_1518257 [Imleria badia]|nr:hypothetical protein OG21DRAFT_1518257 [Imleria badia]
MDSPVSDRSQNKGIERRKANIDIPKAPHSPGLRYDKPNLQSILDTKEVGVVEANRRISALETALATARNEVKRMKDENSNLQFSLDTLQVAMAEAKRRWTPGIGDFKQWVCESSIATDIPLLHDDLLASSSENVLAHNALLHVRSKNWSSAYQDAKKSIGIRPSTMGYIAKALAQIGNSEPEKAFQTFDLAFWNCNPSESNLLLLIKTIIFFMAGDYDKAISRVHDLIAVPSDDATMYCCNQVLAKMYLMRDDFERAVHSLERAQAFASSNYGSHLESISIIFGWSFDGLQITVQRYRCKALHAAGRTEEAAKALRKMLESFDKEICASKETAAWLIDLKNKCVDALEALGDAALSSGQHAEAISRYSSALSLDPSNPMDILAKRSKARASKGIWEGALTDANEVIKLDPSSHRGYERKHAALHGAEDYGEAINAILRTLSKIESSPDEEIRQLRRNYTAPLDTIAIINSIVHEIFELCPLVLIDVTTGKLCDAHERIRLFRSEKPFKKLVSETATMKLDHKHILQAVAEYFKWVMFSHTWEGEEPTFQDVNVVDTIWNLDKSSLNEKLRQFCTTVRVDGYRWAWSDTCCIDKRTSDILSRSLTSMYRWYEEAAATLVYLADVLSSSELGGLTKSRWMTRAWTLQELLASKVIRFYDREWKLYLKDTHDNHKESPAIRLELAQAMGVAPETIARFRPADLGVREKLRLASTRRATVEEDVAYSLIGIFSSDIVPRYGLGKTALGHLLENIVACSGDVTVIAWTGKSLPYNSALPASLAVYSKTPYSPPPMAVSDLDTQVELLRTRLPPKDAQESYARVIQLPRVTFSNRCLYLPCIVFSISKILVHELGASQEHLYRATALLLGEVKFRTADSLPLQTPHKLVFVHPWLHDLHDPHDGFVMDGDLEVDVDVEVESSASPNDELEAEFVAGVGDGTNNTSAPTSPSQTEPSSSAHVDRYTRALRLIARLGRRFNALLLQQLPNGRYKRVAAEHEIVVPGIPDPITTKKLKVIQARVLEIV